MTKKRFNKRSRRVRRRRTKKRQRKRRTQRGGKFNVILKRLRKLNPFQRRSAIQVANDKFIRHFVSQVKKLKRATGLQPSLRTKLKRHTKALRKLTNRRTSMKRKRKMLSQRGGFLPLLLAALPAIGSIAGGIISRV